MFLLMPHPTRFARWLLATVLILTLNVRSSSANPSPQRFDIPAGDAATALRLAAQQAGREIMFPAAIVQGVRVAAVRGEFTVEEAVTRLLAGTDLQLVNDAVKVWSPSKKKLYGPAEVVREYGIHPYNFAIAYRR